MAFHSGMPWMAGGELGVDLFFVLSGFLITTLLVREFAGTSGISLRQFWARRVRRLFPALVLVLAFVAVYALVVGNPSAMSHLRWDGFASLTYWANWWFIASGQSYFAAFLDPSPLRHLWSLGVEEQWYVVWPPLLLLGLRAARGRIERLLPAVAALAMASIGLMALIGGRWHEVDRAYYGTDTRAHALLIGALAALLLERWPITARRGRAAAQLVALPAAGVVAWMLVNADGRSRSMFEGGYALFGVAAAVVIVAMMQPRSSVLKQVLRLPPLVAVGKISYGLYLWHWPIDLWLQPGRVGWHGYALFGLRSAVALAAATASYVLVEQPIRTRRWQWRRPRLAVLQAGAASMAVLVVATLIGPLQRGPGGAPVAINGEGASPTTLAVRGPTTTVSPRAPVAVAPKGQRVRVMVGGDSVGFTLAYIVQPKGIELYSTAWLGCGVLPDGVPLAGGATSGTPEKGCQEQRQRWLAALQHRPEVVLLSFGAWEVFDQYFHGRIYRVYSPAMRRLLTQQLQSDVDFVEGHSRARVVFLDVPCMADHQSELGGGDSPRNDPARRRWVQGALDQVVKSNPGRVFELPIGDFLCRHGKAREVIDGVVVRPDGVHYSGPGADLVWKRWLGPRIIRLARTSSGGARTGAKVPSRSAGGPGH